MDEAIKFIGGISWAVGVILLFVAPVLGIIVLLIAVLATVSTVSRTRERRHQELLDAARNAKGPPPSS